MSANEIKLDRCIELALEYFTLTCVWRLEGVVVVMVI